MLSQRDGSQYAPSIDVDGTVYYARSRGTCGNRVRLVRHPVVRQIEELWRLPSGNDVGSTDVFVSDEGAVTLLFDHFGCGRPAQSDAWRMLDADGDATVLTVTIEGSGSGVVTSTPAGIDCGGDCEHDFPAGATVTLTATPATGSTFEGWSGACTGTGACQVVLARSLTVTATFSPSATPNPSPTATPPPSPSPTGPGPTGPTATGSAGPS